MARLPSSHSARHHSPSPSTLMLTVVVVVVLVLIKMRVPESEQVSISSTEVPVIGRAETTVTVTAQPAPPLFTNAAALACLPSQTRREQAKVVEITDGDTIVVELGGRRYKVRYIGIDTPESTTRVEYWGLEATERNRTLVAGQKVTLIKDVSETDRYNRLLRYVLVRDVFVNYELVRGGYANALRYPPDVACAEVFREAEQQAREEGLGLWAPTPIPTP